MQFLMLVCTDLEPETDPTHVPDIEAWVADVEASGAWRAGDRLRPREDARTVRVRGGVRQVIEGPFAETAEWIAGFDLLECDSLEDAIEIAARHPMAHEGRIEVRPVWPLDLDLDLDRQR